MTAGTRVRAHEAGLRETKEVKCKVDVGDWLAQRGLRWAGVTARGTRFNKSRLKLLGAQPYAHL
jgi:hypothetical protein